MRTLESRENCEKQFLTSFYFHCVSAVKEAESFLQYPGKIDFVRGQTATMAPKSTKRNREKWLRLLGVLQFCSFILCHKFHNLNGGETFSNKRFSKASLLFWRGKAEKVCSNFFLPYILLDFMDLPRRLFEMRLSGQCTKPGRSWHLLSPNLLACITGC